MNRVDPHGTCSGGYYGCGYGYCPASIYGAPCSFDVVYYTDYTISVVSVAYPNAYPGTESYGAATFAELNYLFTSGTLGGNAVAIGDIYAGTTSILGTLVGIGYVTTLGAPTAAALGIVSGLWWIGRTLGIIDD